MTKANSNIIKQIKYWILLIVFVSIISFLITIFILLVFDGLFNEKSIYQTNENFKSGFVTRLNPIFAIFVFVICCVGTTIAVYLAAIKSEADDDEILNELQSNTSNIGKSVEVSGLEKSFSSSIEIGKTKFSGNFVIQTIGKSTYRQQFCAASVSFEVPAAKEFFQIEESKSILESGSKNYLISPVSDRNATKMLEGRYEYSYSDYRFFNDFISDDVIAEDLAIRSNHHETKTKLLLKNGVFLIQYRQQTSSDEDQSQKESVKILKQLFARAEKYHLRFQEIGLIDS